MDKLIIISLAIISAVLLIIGVNQAINLNSTQLANPSAVYCEEQGYDYEIRNFINGSTGFCVFLDGSECLGWDYFRGDCTRVTASNCQDYCGDGVCQEVVCQSIGCPCPESEITCPIDCS